MQGQRSAQRQLQRAGFRQFDCGRFCRVIHLHLHGIHLFIVGADRNGHGTFLHGRHEAVAHRGNLLRRSAPAEIADRRVRLHGCRQLQSIQQRQAHGAALGQFDLRRLRRVDNLDLQRILFAAEAFHGDGGRALCDSRHKAVLIDLRHLLCGGAPLRRFMHCGRFRQNHTGQLQRLADVQRLRSVAIHSDGCDLRNRIKGRRKLRSRIFAQTLCDALVGGAVMDHDRRARRAVARNPLRGGGHQPHAAVGRRLAQHVVRGLVQLFIALSVEQNGMEQDSPGDSGSIFHIYSADFVPFLALAGIPLPGHGERALRRIA